MKKIIIAATALLALVPVAVQAEETRRFEHGGSVYVYTVTETSAGRVISGVEEKSGQPFKLRVGERRVRGTVGSQEVSFAIRDVKPLAAPAATTLASR